VFYTLNTIITDHLLHQTAIRYGQEFDDIKGVSAAPRVVVQDSFIAGGAQQDWLRTEHHGTLTDAFTWTRANHTVKAGVNIPDWSRRRFDDKTNTAGTFYFSNLPQYEAGLPYAFIQQQGNGHQAFLEKVVGVFAQDEIQVTPQLTTTVGLRYYWQNYFHDNNNFAPRASVAWAPGGLSRTIVRGGLGLFYDRSGPLVINDLLTSRAGLLKRYVISDPGYPDPLPPGQLLEAQPSNVTELAPDVHIPSTLQYSAGVERQLGRATTISVTYTGMRGHSLFFSRDVNAPPPPLYDGRLDASLGVFRQIESRGRLTSQSVQVTFRGRVTRVFNGQLQYSFGRARNNTSGVSWFPANDYDLSGEWARADFDREHAFEGLGTFRLGPATQFGVSVSLSTGKPYTMFAGEDLYGNARGTARPAGIPRNSLIGPGYEGVDLRLARDFTLHPRSKPNDPWMLTVGLDAFNVLNHTNFTSYVGTVTSPLFGQATAAFPPRRLQLSVRTRF
jgi:outer membrane receptor protein involved in Fe transport